MNAFENVTLEVTDTEAAAAFYQALGVSQYVNVRASDEPTSGFRSFTLSIVTSQPANVDAFMAAAAEAGAATLKPAAKSFWGYGGVIQAPDGTIFKITSSNKKNSGPAAREIDEFVLLLGVDDVKASKRFYVDRGLGVAKSFGGKYVQFETSSTAITLALYPRHALAKDSGVSKEGDGSHRVVLGGGAGTFTDPDGFAWEATAA